MNVKYYIINGVSASGKDTFVSFVPDPSKGVDYIHCSSVNYIKELAGYAGWNGEKDEKGRNLLSGLKHLLTEYDDIPFKRTVEDVEHWVEFVTNHPRNVKTFFVFIDVREPEEVEKYKDYFNAKTILIRNPSAEKKVFNESDLNVLDYNYDYIIWNRHDKKVLMNNADRFIRYECFDDGTYKYPIEIDNGVTIKLGE